MIPKYSVTLRSCTRGMHNLRGGMGVTALLESKMVGRADAGQHRQSLRRKRGMRRRAPAADPTSSGTICLRPQVIAQRVGPRCHHRIKAVPANTTID